MNQELQVKIQAWVDGELEPAEAGRIQALAAADPEVGALAGNLRSFRQCLRDHPPVRAVPETREFYWSAIRRGIERAEREARSTDGHHDRDHAQASSPTAAAAGWLGWFIPAFAVGVAVLLALRPGSVPARRGSTATQAMVEHVVEAPLPDMNTITFYSARDAMTVVWVGRVDML